MANVVRSGALLQCARIAANITSVADNVAIILNLRLPQQLAVSYGFYGIFHIWILTAIHNAEEMLT